MQSQQTEEVISGGLRLALGGILIEKEKMIVQVSPFNIALKPLAFSQFSTFIDTLTLLK